MIDHSFRGSPYRSWSRSVSLATLLALSTACGDESPGSASPTTAGTSAAGGAGGSSDGGGRSVGAGASGGGGEGGSQTGGSGGAAACNALVNDGDKIYVQQIAEAVPIGEGGVIEDGLYVLTAVAYYTGVGGDTGPQGPWVQSKFTTANGAVEYVHLVSGEEEVRVTGMATPLHAEITTEFTCPKDMGPVTQPYTASLTDVTIIYPKNTWTYTRQGHQP